MRIVRTSVVRQVNIELYVAVIEHVDMVVLLNHILVFIKNGLQTSVKVSVHTDNVVKIFILTMSTDDLNDLYG